MSERSLGTELKSSAQSPAFTYVIMAKIQFENTPLYTHNGVGKITYDGNNYLGVGSFGRIEPYIETLELSEQPIRLQLISLDDDIITEINDYNMFGADVDLYIAAVDEANQLDGTPFNWLVGHVERPSMIVGERNILTLDIQTRASRLKKKNNKRWTLEEHQKQYPGEVALMYLPYITNATPTWAGERVRTGFANRGSITGGNDYGTTDTYTGGAGWEEYWHG